jgi:nitrous oxidase accessory protein
MQRLNILRLLLLAMLFWIQGGNVRAQGSGQTIIVSPQGPYTALTDAMAVAREGDTIAVYGGRYAGPLVIEKRVTLLGYDWPIVDGNNHGTVVKLTAPGIVLKGFVIRNSGSSLDAENSGIAVEAPEALLANNRIEETLFGIYLRKASHTTIQGNVISSKDLPLPRRGDPIRVWYSNSVRITENVVQRGRDVVLWYSKNLLVRGNVVTKGRYGLHFMYCDDAQIEENRLTDNSVGTFLMYSRRLHLRRNTIAHNRGPSGYGVGLKDMDDAVIEENLFLDNRVGAFIDNSPREIDSRGLFQRNVFAFNDTGISLLPAVRRNQFMANSFVDNQEQVGIAGGGQLEGNRWTVKGRGNYWSDYVGYDAQSDGVGDVPYRADRLFENLMDRYPVLRVFVHSPAAQAVDFAARAFPFVKPQPKLTDTRPLMAPVIPLGLPPLPQQTGQPLGVASLVLLTLAVALVLFPRLQFGRRTTIATPCSYHGGTFMIHVHDLTKRFGALVALDHLSFAVQPGEAVALWGTNGAGKTTALRCLLGLLPYAGTIQLHGYDVSLHGKTARRFVGFVPQELRFHDDLTVQETLHFYARLKKASLEPIESLLKRLNLFEHVRKPVKDLSGGMKQRLALAIALLADPPLLMLDEPTANLDARAREAFLALLFELKAAGKTLIFSSHRQDEVLSLADRILILEQGRLVADCAPDKLRDHWRWQAMLRLHVPNELVEPALTTLQRHGFNVSRNGTGVRVQVTSSEKGKPFHVLMEANIPVPDFDVEHLNEEK